MRHKEINILSRIQLKWCGLRVVTHAKSGLKQMQMMETDLTALRVSKTNAQRNDGRHNPA